MTWVDDADDAGSAYVGGTGSISCLAITEADAAKAAEKRGPLGFASQPADEWGESSWVSRDLLPT